MKKEILTIFIIVFILACKADNNKKSVTDSNPKNIESKIKFKANELQENLYKALVVKKETPEEINVDFVFNKQKIVHPQHQKILLSYLISAVDDFSEFNKVNFNYYVEGENETNLNHLSFDKNQVNSIKAFYESNSVSMKMIEFCLSNFRLGTPFALDVWVENTNKKYPDDTIKSNFFELLEKFSNECSGRSDKKDAKATIVIMYVAVKDYIEKDVQNNIEPQENTKQILESLWKICNDGEMIEFAEQRLFGQVGGNW